MVARKLPIRHWPLAVSLSFFCAVVADRDEDHINDVEHHLAFNPGDRVRSLESQPNFKPRALNLGDEGTVYELFPEKSKVLVLFDGDPPLWGRIFVSHLKKIEGTGEVNLTKCEGKLCDGVPDSKFATMAYDAATNTYGRTNSKCMCLITAEDCTCKGCMESEQIAMCLELLGPCRCRRSPNGLCDCSGYCHKRFNRRHACEREQGCEWAGSWGWQWCQAIASPSWSTGTGEKPATPVKRGTEM